jgi:hypothetical protein
MISKLKYVLNLLYYYFLLENSMYVSSQIEQVKYSTNSLPNYSKNLYHVFWITLLALGNLLTSQWLILLLLGLLPVVSATPDHNVFSDVTFRAFSEFVEANFSSRISLASVLVVLFTTTSNTDLLNLHA